MAAERSHRGEVVLLSRQPDRDGHDYRTRAALAERIAALIGYDFAGDYDENASRHTPRYFVPGNTLLAGEAAALGIVSESDLFGGFVPHRFMATKAITHPLVAGAARHPDGWPHELGYALRDIALRGFSAFSVDDVRNAIERILNETGTARVKLADASGGIGQYLVHDAAGADALVAKLDASVVETSGLVVEEDLVETTTYSVGSVNLRGAHIAYCGTQRTTLARHGTRVYAGSDLFVVRGDFERIAGRDVRPHVGMAVDCAIRYDRIATEVTGACASRRNYDVLHGYDAEGRERVGVLEQSWRLGGGSGAEIAAFEAFARDPALPAVRASTFESYSNDPPPNGATIYFRDEDATHGPTIKYSLLEPDAGHGHSC